MRAYAIEYPDGRITPIAAANDDEAHRAVTARFPTALVGRWSADGENDDGETMVVARVERSGVRIAYLTAIDDAG